MRSVIFVLVHHACIYLHTHTRMHARTDTLWRFDFGSEKVEKKIFPFRRRLTGSGAIFDRHIDQKFFRVSMSLGNEWQRFENDQTRLKAAK